MRSLSNAELLRLAQKETKETVKTPKQIDAEIQKAKSIPEVERFILAFNLKEGIYWVKVRDVYDAYCSWAAYPMKKNEFGIEFKKFFKQHRRKYRYYCLNIKAWHLVMEGRRLENQYDSKEKQEIE